MGSVSAMLLAVARKACAMAESLEAVVAMPEETALTPELTPVMPLWRLSSS